MMSVSWKKKLAMVCGVVIICPVIAMAQDNSPGSKGSAADPADKGSQMESLLNVFPVEISTVIDLEQAAIAVRESDEEVLLGMAEKLGDSARGFPNPGQKNPALQGQITFLKGSINACRIKRDGKALDSIAKSIDANKGLPAPVKGELKGLINVTRAAIAAGRKLNPGPDLKTGEASPEAVSIYNAFVDEIAVTEEYGTKEDAAALEFAVKQLTELHAKQRDHLVVLLKDATKTIADRGAADQTLSLLASASRSLESGLKIVGPIGVRPGSTVHLKIISASPPSPTDKQKLPLIAQASNAMLLGAPAGKASARSIEFTGKVIGLDVAVGQSGVCSVALVVDRKPIDKQKPICGWGSKILPKGHPVPSVPIK